MRTKVSVGLNECEDYHLRKLAAEKRVSLPEAFRQILHEYVIEREGEGAAVFFLRGRAPE